MRCPRHPRTKFGDCIDGDGFVEVACRPCRKDVDRFDPPIFILHVFEASTGRCIDTLEVVRAM